MKPEPKPMPEFVEGKEGVIFDLPDEDYRKAPGVSNSMLKHIAPDGEEPGSPAHFKQALSDPQMDTDALFFGRQVHSRILTPDEPLPGIVAIPETYPAPADCSAVRQKKANPGDPLDWSGNAKYCKRWKAEQEAAGLRPMSAEDIANLDGVVNAIANDSTCRIIFSKGRSEVSCFNRVYVGNNQPILLKGRMDWIPEVPCICDIKTCLDARASEVAGAMFKRRYYVQAAIYTDLWNALVPDNPKPRFVFIFVEKFAPYAIQIFELEPADIEEGRWEYKHNLALLAVCLATDKWPAYEPGVHMLKMRVPYAKGKTVLPL